MNAQGIALQNELVTPSFPVGHRYALSRGRGHRPITEDEVGEICAITNPVLRNLRITLGYHDLLLDMTQLLGTANISWPGFACWASRTAGSFIRGEYIPDSIQVFLNKLKHFYAGIHAAHRVLTGMRGAVLPPRSLFDEILERVSGEVTKQIAAGNRMVFKDISVPYARMIRQFSSATTYSPRALDSFLGQLKPGRVEDGGQDLLISAFGCYYKAIFERDRKKKAELILLANDQIGLHEQTRLQTSIAESINAPVAEFIASAARERAHTLTHRRLHRPLDRLIDRTLNLLSRWIQSEWQSIATSWYMHLQMPVNVQDGMVIVDKSFIRLGDDTPPACPHREFPRDLTAIDNDELRRLLGQLDRSPDSLTNNRAKNWANLDDRMDFLVDLFRTRQQDKRLYFQPFADRQIDAIRAGIIPDGSL